MRAGLDLDTYGLIASADYSEGVGGGNGCFSRVLGEVAAGGGPR